MQQTAQPLHSTPPDSGSLFLPKGSTLPDLQVVLASGGFPFEFFPAKLLISKTSRIRLDRARQRGLSSALNTNLHLHLLLLRGSFLTTALAQREGLAAEPLGPAMTLWEKTVLF